MNAPHDSLGCARCASPLAAAILTCPACGHVLVDAVAAQAASAAAEQLLHHLAGSPYFRDAGQLAYTLRGHVRGFLEDPSHPLSRELLRFLAVVALEGGPAGMRHLLAWTDATVLRARARPVSAAVRYVALHHAGHLRALAEGAQAQALRALRLEAGADVAALAAASAAASAQRDAAVAQALAQWCGGAAPPPARHSM